MIIDMLICLIPLLQLIHFIDKKKYPKLGYLDYVLAVYLCAVSVNLSNIIFANS